MTAVTGSKSIEDIILSRDRRGISALRRHLPRNFCEQAASEILNHPGTVLIVTGFYIAAAGAIETDGPPGAVAIGDALQSLGYDILYVVDQYAAPLATSLRGANAPVVEFPIAEDDPSKRFAKQLLQDIAPTVLVSIERCGLTDEGLYRNMHGVDISAYSARMDHLFLNHPHSVGIGDGGNEIGMGAIVKGVAEIHSLVKKPCITRTTRLVISSVSNWGGYGLVASLSRRTGRNLLPSIDAERELVKRSVDMGAVDGMSAKPEYRVDGFTLEENSEVVASLHTLLAEEGISS